MKLRSSLNDVKSLGAHDRDRMFELMERTYENKNRESFDIDLNAKRWVILVRCPADCRIVGFSTQVLLKCHIDGERVTALYSGDTVVDRSYWGDPALAHAWGNFALSLIDRHTESSGNLYWFLTSKGFRTYHYLPLFFRRYAPRAGVDTSREDQSVISAFGKCVGGGRYDAQHGVIRADNFSDYVRREIADSGGRRDKNKHFQSFIGLNPGYMRGDELCCIALLSRENFTSAAYRVMGVEPAPEFAF